MTGFRQHHVCTPGLSARATWGCNHSGPLVHLNGQQRPDRDTPRAFPCKTGTFGMSRRTVMDAGRHVRGCFGQHAVSTQHRYSSANGCYPPESREPAA